MGSGTGNSIRRAGVVCAALIFASVILSSPPASAEYPRRVAIAPFTSLAKEDIQQTVSVLPRLLSSRLMALAGAEVTLLPPGDKPATELARDARVPLLLQGTVSKLGKGYSIDVTALDLETGKMPGAFFAAANTEDDIIPQLGILSAEIAEKLFGVKTVVRAAPPAPPSTLPALPSPVPSAPSAIPAVGAAIPAETRTTGSGTGQAASLALAEGWIPSALKKLSQSDKIPDEVYGVVAGDRDADGNDEVIAYGKNTLYLYRVKGKEIFPFTRVSRSRDHHFLAVDAIDLDGDGKKEILVTDLVGDTVESFVLKRNGDVYEEAAGKIPYYMVVLPDWMGKQAVVGQSPAMDVPFYGKFVVLRWDGKRFVAGNPLPHNTNILPLATGLPGLSSARFVKEWRLIYTDETARLRIVDSGGKSQYKSRGFFGANLDYFEWGPYIPLEGRRKPYPLRKAARVAPGGGEFPLVLIPEVKKGILDVTRGSYDTTRLVLLQWDGGEFLEKAGTESSNHFFSGADFLSTSGLRRGDKIVASAIEQTGGFFKDMVSRLLLYQLE